MEFKPVNLELPKETYELGQVVFRLMAEVQKAKADGWNSLTDIPAVILNSLQDVMSAVEGIDKIDNEFKADPVAASMAIAYPVAMGVRELLKK